MHKADIEKLEDILTNQNKYKQYLQLRQMELEYSTSEELPKHVKENKHLDDIQDPRTIRSGSNVSTVEVTVEKLFSDIEYQTLYSIVTNTPKFINSMNEYERIIYEYRYNSKDIMVYEWEEITEELDCLAMKKGKSFSKSTTLRLRGKMLKRLAKYVGYTFM